MGVSLSLGILPWWLLGDGISRPYSSRDSAGTFLAQAYNKHRHTNDSAGSAINDVGVSMMLVVELHGPRQVSATSAKTCHKHLAGQSMQSCEDSGNQLWESVVFPQPYAYQSVKSSNHSAARLTCEFLGGYYTVLVNAYGICSGRPIRARRQSVHLQVSLSVGLITTGRVCCSV